MLEHMSRVLINSLSRYHLFVIRHCWITHYGPAYAILWILAFYLLQFVHVALYCFILQLTHLHRVTIFEPFMIHQRKSKDLITLHFLLLSLCFTLWVVWHVLIITLAFDCRKLLKRLEKNWSKHAKIISDISSYNCNGCTRSEIQLRIFQHVWWGEEC